jgi:hypothetical protein
MGVLIIFETKGKFMNKQWMAIVMAIGMVMAGLGRGTAWAQTPVPTDSAAESDTTPTATPDVDAEIKTLSDQVADLKKGFSVQIHGFVEADMIGDDTQSFKESVGNSPVVSPGTTAGDNGELQFSPRNSRIDFLAQAPELDGWKSKGYLEADFLWYDPAPSYNAAATNAAPTNSELNLYTQPSIRVRLAYLDAQNDGWELLVGQYWSLFGWQANYFMSTIGVTPYSGVLFERTPQFRVMKTFDGDAKLEIGVSAERPEEDASMVPNFDGGIRFSLQSWKGRFSLAQGNVNTVPFSIGLSGTFRNYSYGAAGTNVDLSQNAEGGAVAVDTLIPVLSYDGKDGASLVLTGEWSAGNGDGDELPNWTGGLPSLNGATNGLNMDPGIAGFTSGGKFTLVDIESWNTQFQFNFPKSWNTYITAGYGELYSDNIGGLTAGGAAASKLYNDDSSVFANVVHDFSSNIRFGLEYARFDTHYSTQNGDVLDHRTELTGWYRF